jgi:hypothetical protein
LYQGCTYQGESGQVRRLVQVTPQTRRLKFNLSGRRHRQQIENAFLASGNPLILLHREQDVGRTASIGDENGTSLSGSLCPACVLIKVSTRQFRNAHGYQPFNVATWLHYNREPFYRDFDPVAEKSGFRAGTVLSDDGATPVWVANQSWLDVRIPAAIRNNSRWYECRKKIIRSELGIGMITRQSSESSTTPSSDSQNRG